jgi:hypothetical protein
MIDLSWLPPLEPNIGYSGWSAYEAKIYGIFEADFVLSKPTFMTLPVRLKWFPPPTRGMEETFWHIVSEGPDESSREIVLDRCERIRYPLAIINASDDQSKVITWLEMKRNKNGSTEPRWHLALADFSYLLVLAARRDHVLLWTGYNIEQAHQRNKLYKRFLSCAGPKETP